MNKKGDSFIKVITSEDRSYKLVPSLLLNQLITSLMSQEISRQEACSLGLPSTCFEPQLQSPVLQNKIQP